MTSSLILRPFECAVLWTTCGVGSGWILPKTMSSFGIVYSSGLLSTTLYGGAICVLLPIGMARGVIHSIQDTVQTRGKESIQQLVESNNNNSTLLLSKDTKLLFVDRLTLGSGWRGQVARTVMSPFLPSTAQMMVRVQEVAGDNNDSKVIAAAVSGFVEGFLQDKKDTITTMGLLAYAVLFGAGVGIDYTYRKADEKKQAFQEQLDEKKHVIIEKLQAPLDAMQERYNTAKEKTETKTQSAMGSISNALERAKFKHEENRDIFKNATEKANAKAEKTNGRRTLKGFFYGSKGDDNPKKGNANVTEDPP